MPLFELSLLGPFRFRLDGQPVPGVTSSKIQALLAYLAVTSPRRHARETLAETLWPERPPGTAGQNLRKSLSRLNKALHSTEGSQPLLLIDNQGVQFNPQSQARVDVFDFNDALDFTRRHAHRRIQRCRRCCARLESAMPLYRGEFLQDVDADSPSFDEWTLLQREWFRREALHALSTLSEHYEWRRDYAAAYRFAWRQVEIEPWQEGAHRGVMRALALMGRRAEALKAYERLAGILRDELGLAPADETQALVAAIRSGSLQARSRQDQGATARLPAQHSAFIGREEELAQVSERLDDPNCHLLTLTGLGGVGKSRLALQIAAEKADEYQDGVCYVPLAGLESGQYLLSALISALGVPRFGEGQGEAALKETLLASLEGMDLLLILDNYEHLLPEAALLVEILERAPSVTILVTSRQPLNLGAEWIVDLGGLECPPEDRLAEIEDYAAARLFIHHAARKLPGFKPGAQNAPALARICRLVAGLPLGIELAAASLRRTPLEQIAVEIAANLDFLATQMPDASPRHRSLRAVFEQSWRLLDPDERQALRKAAVFQGEFTTEAAREVIEAGRSVLASLAEKSLLQTPGDERFELHQVLRQYAAEKLSERPEAAEEVAERHARYYMRLFAAQDENAWRLSPEETRARLAPEIENVRAAWRWAIGAARLDLIEAGYAELARFYAQLSYLNEGCRLLGDAVALARAEIGAAGGDEAPRGLLAGLLGEQVYFLYALARYPETIEAGREVLLLDKAQHATPAAAKACLYWGSALMRQGDYTQALARVGEACRLAQGAGQPQLEADGLRTMGMIYVRAGDYSQAEDHYRRSLALCRERGYRWGEAHALGGLGNVHMVQEQTARARSYYTQAIQIFEAVGDQAGLSTYLDNLGTTHWAEGEYGHATDIHRRSLQVRTRIGDRRGQGATLVKLGIQAHYQGDFSQGEAHYREALEIYRQIGYRRGEGEALAHLCLLYHQRGDNRSARRYGEEAVEIDRQLNDPSDLGYALTFLGHALFELACPAEAAQAYQEALNLRTELGERSRSLEPRAGLAQLALAHGDLQGALAHADSILAQLESGELSLVDEPVRVYLAAYQALEAGADRRAGAVLEKAHRFLQVRAAKIQAPHLRRSFLENIPAHRKLLEIYARK